MSDQAPRFQARSHPAHGEGGKCGVTVFPVSKRLTACSISRVQCGAGDRTPDSPVLRYKISRFLFSFAANARGSYIKNSISGVVVGAQTQKGVLKDENMVTMSTVTEAGRPVTHLLDVVYNDLSEATSEDTERSQDGTKRVDPHKVDLSL